MHIQRYTGYYYDIVIVPVKRVSLDAEPILRKLDVERKYLANWTGDIS